MRLYLLILSLFCCALGFAQSTITGKVTDSNNLPLPGVNVAVSGDTAGTITDTDGNFTLKTTVRPPFTIELTNVGFATQKVSITSASQKVSVQLKEEQTQLDEIVVSASRTPERVLESPVTIERMGLQDIKNTSSVSYYDGLENLKEVHFNTSSASFKSVNTRGFATVANTRFMQLVDGMDNSSPALNFVLGNLIGLSELDVANVELLPGASSALYGANAFNGILFMNSKSPFKSEGISFYLKGGKTYQKAAGANEFWDFGIRAAHKFSDYFAGKVNFTYMQGKEWIASDTRDMAANPSGLSPNPNYDGLNLYGDEVSTNIKDVGRSLASLGLIPAGAVNLLPNYNVARTGYREQDLSDNNVKSVKADFSLHYRPLGNEDLEIIAQHKLGFGNTIYQGANRYYLKNFYMNQTRLEIIGKHFFVRGYMTDENAGNSYDMRFAAWNVNRAWKDDATWFGQYAGAFIQARLAGAVEEQANQIARATADSGRYLPGTPEYKAALKSVTSDPNLTTGAKFLDQSKLYHADANYNFKEQISFAEIQLGSSFRRYRMDSQGTIFTDYDGPITYDEYGFYGQAQKKFMNDRLKFTGSLRYDKSQNFDGSFSPRVSFVYSADEAKKHNFRVSYQTGFRNPTTQDQYIGLDLGPFALIGSAPDNLNRFVEDRNVSASGQAIGQGTSVTLDGNNAYYHSYTVTSVQQYLASAAAGTPDASILEVARPGLVKPEKVQAFELGYRTNIGNKYTVDISGYYNMYNDFLNTSNVIAPYYGILPGNYQFDTDLAATALRNGDRRTYQIYTNSKSDIQSYGVGIGGTAKVYKDFEIGANYNYACYEFDQASDPGFEPAFNTPKHRVKGSFGNPKLFKNFGFNTNIRWNTAYLWQSSFADGMIPENTVFDAQINYAIPSLKSVIKIGGTNLFGSDYLQVFGSGAIGKTWFASLTINP